MVVGVHGAVGVLSQPVGREEEQAEIREEKLTREKEKEREEGLELSVSLG